MITVPIPMVFWSLVLNLVGPWRELAYIPSFLVLNSVLFLAGGNMKRGISEGSRTWGFLTISLSDAEPALAKLA
jgi:hypothetical protein